MPLLRATANRDIPLVDATRVPCGFDLPVPYERAVPTHQICPQLNGVFGHKDCSPVPRTSIIGSPVLSDESDHPVVALVDCGVIAHVIRSLRMTVKEHPSVVAAQ